MKQKFKNRNLKRGVHLDPRGYVFVRLFHDGKPLPKKSFGKKTKENIDRAERYASNIKEELRTGQTTVEGQKAVRWPFPYAWEQYKPHCPKSRLYCGKPLNKFFGKYYFDELWFKVVEEYRPVRRSQGVQDNSINLEISVLGAMFHKFQQLKLLNKIPNVVLPVQSPRKGVSWVDEEQFNDDRVITDDEYKLMMKEASPRLRRRIDAALNTGLRKKDIFALRKDSLDPYMRRLKGLSFKVKSTYKAPVNKVVAHLFETADGDEVIDDTNHKREMNQLRKICREKYGMRDFTFKDFRRTAGMRILREVKGDKGILLCKAFYNHKRIDTTMKYLGLTFEDLDKAGEILAGTFNYQIQTEPKTEPKTEMADSHKMTQEAYTEQVSRG